MANIHQRVSKNISALLSAKKLTAEGLAHSLDVDKAHISRIISGKKRASLNLLERIAEILEVDIQKLFKK
jgi:transcriptional regulator with XRE-family HTH domain